VVFIVIDLDRPRRGFIEVSQESLTNLQKTTEATKKLTPNTSLNQTGKSGTPPAE
jgi:hypothetical protein